MTIIIIVVVVVVVVVVIIIILNVCNVSAYTDLETSKAEEAAMLSEEAREGELKVEKLEQELKHANELLAAQKSGSFSLSQDEVENMFPAAAATSRILKSGMTLTQVMRLALLRI
jgi:alkylhydroperoxidase family enzyme